MTIPFIDLKTQYQQIQSHVQERINRVLEHGQYIMGPEVAELEEKLSSFCGTQHCITVASGTEALLISLMALGINPGDEVITTPFTFVATAEVIVLLGAVPIFVDIEPDTGNIDANKIESAITKKTRAIIPVSLYGQTADMDAINAIAAQYNLPVIEDAAQSFGATYKGRKSCALSTIGCTSFFPSKPLGCYGDGGAIFTDDDTIAQACREIRVHGQKQRYVHTRVGVGGRMDTIQCAVVLAKLKHFEWELERRVLLGHAYTQSLMKIPFITVPKVHGDRVSVWGQYTIQVEARDAIAAYLKTAGIPTAVHYPLPLHCQSTYQARSRVSQGLPQSEILSRRVLSLPMHPYLRNEEISYITDTLRRYGETSYSPLNIG